MDEIILKVIETATAMTVAALAMLIMWKFMGQRTDPKLIALFETMTKATAERDEGRDNADERLALALDRNTAAFSAFTNSIRQIVSTISTGQTTQGQAITTGIATLQQNTEGVNDMKTELESVLAELQAMRLDMQTLIETVNRATDELKDTVTSKTAEYETRINQVELSVKDLQPEEPPIKPKPPGVPVTPKPNNEDLIEALKEAKIEAENKPEAEEKTE